MMFMQVSSCHFHVKKLLFVSLPKLNVNRNLYLHSYNDPFVKLSPEHLF
jgi:hypothetical protein